MKLARESDGSKINLRDYLDFRPVATLQHSIDSAPGATNVIKTTGHFNITFDSNGEKTNVYAIMLSG